MTTRAAGRVATVAAMANLSPRFALGLLVLVGIGCAGDGPELGSKQSEMRMIDCRADDSCPTPGGPADPAPPPPPPPPPEKVPDCGGETNPSFPSARPWAEDQSEWLRGANRYAQRTGSAAGYTNFHHVTIFGETKFGTILLGTPAIAFWRDVPATTLGSNVRVADVIAMMRSAQGYARSIGYSAALPTFEENIVNGQLVYGINILSPAAVEVREVDGCELGNPDPYDIEAVFRGAYSYAQRNGYVGAIPTFEVRYVGNGRIIFTVILHRSDTTVWRSVYESELSMKCGDIDQQWCDPYDHGCRAGTREIIGYCEPATTPPPCGGDGELCCPGRTCDGALTCNYDGLFRPSKCGDKVVLPYCGDGKCTSDEACWCASDCADTELCRLSYPCDGKPQGAWTYCAVCEGDDRSERVEVACSEEEARTAVENDFGRCEVYDGSCN